jgi:hypothetical protein
MVVSTQNHQQTMLSTTERHRHVEFYVGNAHQAAYFYRIALAMSLVAYAGPETVQRDRTSYVLEQGKIRSS